MPHLTGLDIAEAIRMRNQFAEEDRPTAQRLKLVLSSGSRELSQES
jgi:hypothetical protein